LEIADETEDEVEASLDIFLREKPIEAATETA
jgi:hypothetical protein